MMPDMMEIFPVVLFIFLFPFGLGIYDGKTQTCLILKTTIVTINVKSLIKSLRPGLDES